MESAKEAREARRRRILERSADRLAYITGERKVAPLSSPSSAPVKLISTTSDVLEVPKCDLAHPSSQTSKVDEEGTNGAFPQSNADSEERELDREEPEEATPEWIQREISDVRLSQSDTLAHTIENELRSQITSAVPFLSVHTSEVRTGIESAEAAESDKRAYERQSERNRISTIVRNFSRSIDASRGARVVIALSVALLVLCQTFLSSYGHPFGRALKIWLPQWPISLIFLSDVALAFGAFLLNSMDKIVPEEEGASSAADGGLGSISAALDAANKVEDILNFGLLLKKVVEAMSLDCSIYIVVLTCGFSIAQYWFSSSHKFNNL